MFHIVSIKIKLVKILFVEYFQDNEFDGNVYCKIITAPQPLNENEMKRENKESENE